MGKMKYFLVFSGYRLQHCILSDTTLFTTVEFLISLKIGIEKYGHVYYLNHTSSDLSEVLSKNKKQNPDLIFNMSQSSSERIEDTLTGILAMDHLQKKADHLISDMEEREKRLSLLEKNLHEEKLKLARKIRKNKT